jgi:REP element-mobilizing transposase RayT
VTAKSPSGRLLFVDDRARHLYLQLIAREVREREWAVLTYCLMTNHLHVVVRTPIANLGLGFKRINEDFARYINRTRGQEGHVFGGRFNNTLVQSDRHAVGCLRYVARNPIEAGICRNADHWPWSAHPALAGVAAPPRFLDVIAAYEFLASEPRLARSEYRQLVACSDRSLLATLIRPDSDQWLLEAIDDYSISVGEIAAFLDRTKSSVYRRVAAARATVGTVPGVALAEG